jgi:hypothetical protein
VPLIFALPQRVDVFHVIEIFLFHRWTHFSSLGSMTRPMKRN